MSRIAKNPVIIPTGVEVKLNGLALAVKGKLGQLELDVHPSVNVEHKDSTLVFSPKKEVALSKAMVGTMRSLIANMVTGVSDGFAKHLTMVGVGYRAQAKGNVLDISAGFSHPVQKTMPEGITVETPSATEIVVKGVDKQVVGQVAAEIRAIRPPEPYKGKGIRYKDERINMKEGKKK